MALVIGESKRDRKAESDGVWMDYDTDVRFLVARNNNPAYKLFIQDRYTKNERVIDRKNAHADKVAEDITLTALCEHILLGWEGVVDMKQEPIPFSPDVAKEILEEHDDLRQDIYEFASDRANFLQQAEEKAVDTVKK